MANWIVTFFLTSFAMSVVVLLVMVWHNLLTKKSCARQRYWTWMIVLLGFAIPFRPMTGKALINIQLRFSPDILIVWVWALVALCFIGYHTFFYVRFKRMIKRWGVSVDNKQILSVFHAVKQEMGLEGKHIRLQTCSFISSSMLTGFVDSLILLPDQYFDEDELELIFKHELTHYKRHDLLIKLWIVITACIHWFNPILHWMCMVLQAEGEVACDETVLKDADLETRGFYGELILGMIGRKKTMNIALSTCFYAGKSFMKRRLDLIMEPKAKKGKKAAMGIILAAVLVFSSGFIFAINTTLATTKVPKHVAGAEITAERAQELALSKVGGGSVVKCETDFEHNGRVYELTVVYQEHEYEMEIDANTGDIREYDVERLEYDVDYYHHDHYDD